jgi:hypothetical protein
MDRMALRLGLACAALVVAAACSSPDPIIMLPDAAPVDSGTDAGGRVDSGGGGGMCAVTIGTDVPPLPSACLPRCSNATASAVMACTTAMCQQMALMADTTPGVAFTVNGMADTLNCAGCFGYQQLSCANDSCPAETAAYLMCNPMTDSMMCNPQIMALNTCIMGAPAFQTCFNGLATMCFGAASTFVPDFDRRPEQFDALPWDTIDPQTRQLFSSQYAR